MTINDAITALCDELDAGDTPAPLRQPFTCVLIWYSLCRLASEDQPHVVAHMGYLSLVRIRLRQRRANCVAIISSTYLNGHRRSR